MAKWSPTGKRRGGGFGRRLDCRAMFALRAKRGPHGGPSISRRPGKRAEREREKLRAETPQLYETTRWATALAERPFVPMFREAGSAGESYRVARLKQEGDMA